MQSLGRYHIVEQIGSGAMGAVYKARDPMMGRDVALKTILTHAIEGSQSAEFRERFFREAQAAGRLTHPGVVTVYDVSEHEGTPFLVMEYVDGRTLQSILQSGERLEADRIFDFGIQLADALHYAHRHGVIHRDVKPANILVTWDGNLKIADFGIAKLAESQVTSTGQILGTPAFMAPEQFTGAQIDERADLFAVGVVIYWMATGDKPFTGDSVLAVQYKVVHTAPVPPRQLNPAIAVDFEAVILKSVAKDPAERYQSAEELSRDLRALRSNRTAPNRTATLISTSGDSTLPLRMEDDINASAAVTLGPETAKDEPLDLGRTWLCSVVFIDIIEYSRQSLEWQAQGKKRFNQYLREAIKECPESDRVILDTGDGAAICFLGDPETAIFCALRLVGGIIAERQQASPLQVRTGINLGSVKLVKDINGNLNAVGDGINVGQRVMSFASENQILVSRSFYEIASSLSDSYAGLFKYEGVRKDKHLREHTLYELLLAKGTTRNQATGRADALPADNGPELSALQIDRLEKGLTTLIGPIARHLVKGACQRARSLAELRQALLAFIPTPADQERFLNSCGNLLPKTVAAAATPLSTPLPKAEKSTFEWDPSILERARKNLANYMGPVARLLVDRAATKAQTPARLYQLLAEDIPSIKDREKFLKQASI